MLRKEGLFKSSFCLFDEGEKRVYNRRVISNIPPTFCSAKFRRGEEINMKKEITLQDVVSVVEATNNKVEKLADSVEKMDKRLTSAIEVTNKTVEVLAGTMHQGFGRVYHEIEQLDKKIDGVKIELKNEIKEVKTELSDKIESEVGNLAGMCKREFDEMGARFNRVDNEFKEVHEELGQIKNNVIGVERRVTKLEKVAVK